MATRPFAFPPGGDGMGSEGRRVVGGPHTDRTAVVRCIVDAVGYAHAAGVGGEVVIVHPNRRAVPFGAGILEVADQFAFLAVDTDDGKALTLEALPQRIDILELLVPVRTGVGGDLLSVHTQREMHFA